MLSERARTHARENMQSPRRRSRAGIKPITFVQSVSSSLGCLYRSLFVLGNASGTIAGALKPRVKAFENRHDHRRLNMELLF